MFRHSPFFGRSINPRSVLVPSLNKANNDELRMNPKRTGGKDLTRRGCASWGLPQLRLIANRRGRRPSQCQEPHRGGRGERPEPAAGPADDDDLAHDVLLLRFLCPVTFCLKRAGVLDDAAVDVDDLAVDPAGGTGK